MSFLNPLWLWSLLAIIPLTAIYFLKVRPKKQPTNAYFLWQKVFAEKRSSALFQRLRDLFSLLLMLLAFAAAAFALAQPRWGDEKQTDMLIIIDTSASMQAGINANSRIQLAKDKATGIIRSLNGEHRVALATIDKQLKFLTHLSDNPKVLVEQIKQINASDMPLNAQAARSLSNYKLSGDSSAHRIIFITDGSSQLPDFDEKIELFAVGSEIENLGITAADLQWVPGRNDTASCYLKIENTYQKDISTEIELRHQESGVIAKLIPLQLKAGEKFEQIIDFDMAEAGIWTASINQKDDFMLDNEVIIGLNPQQTISIGLKVTTPWFFENCVNAFARTNGLLQIDSESPQITLVEGSADTEESNLLIFNPQQQSQWWTSIGEPLDDIIIETEDGEHPLTQHLDFDIMGFPAAKRLSAPEDAQVFAINHDGTPLLYKLRRGNQTAVVVNLDPSEQNFFLSPWFPTIIHSATMHLAGRESSLAPVYATGTKITLPGNSEQAEIIHNNEASIVTAQSQIELNNSASYRYSADDSEWNFGVSLLSADDSQLAIIDAVSSRQLRTGWPISVWLVVIALLALTLESILYHRRKLG